ncbi:MAG TPA: cytochrome c oxidase subunit 3, partial [Oceanipulchritudo sp.]|nr:cytochrome c oxidase subunit 3 [Oceanipulchritudo sp.]
ISTHLIYRKIYPGVVDPQAIFSIELTGFSSFILLMSSFLMALTVSAAHKRNLPGMRGFLMGTILFGMIFLGGQVYEFAHFVHDRGLTLSSSVFGSTFYVLTGTHGVHVALGVFWLLMWFLASLPAKLADFKGERSLLLQLGIFWASPVFVLVVLYFVKHHEIAYLLAGLGWGVLFPLALLASGGLRGRYKRENALDVEVAGLYWHFVDVVWIIIFTAVYLVEYL